MKYHHALAFSPQWLSGAELEDLCRLASPALQKSTGYSYSYALQTEDAFGDEFIRRALALLKTHGIPRRITANSTAYGYSVMRDYEESDLKGADLLRLHYQKKLASCKDWKMHREPVRDEQGRLKILASDATPNVEFASAHYPDNNVVVSEKVRHLLESGGLVGLRFEGVILKGKSAYTSSEPFWELQSSVTLPTIANTHQLVHFGSTEAEPFRGDYSRVVLINDPPFLGGEIHYRRTDLADIGRFDIANMYEKCYFSRPLVISQRFYQYCLSNDIRLNVEPVRIDP